MRGEQARQRQRRALRAARGGIESIDNVDRFDHDFENEAQDADDTMVTERAWSAAALEARAAAFDHCDWRGLDAWRADLARLAADDSLALESPCLASRASSMHPDRRVVHALFAAWRRGVYQRTAPLLYPRPARLARDRLRIGYLGDGFDRAATATAAAATFGRHARDRFEIYAYALTPPDDTPWRANVKSSVDHWREIAHMQAFEAAGLMLCDDLDVLIDLTTDMTQARPELHLYHPARVHIGGSAAGMPAVRLPLAPRWPARAREGAAQSRAALGLPAQATVLCCPHPAHAIEPGVFGAWMEILRECEDAVLWLAAAVRPACDALRSAAQDAGVDARRLLFAAPLPLEEQHARLGAADLMLDTFLHDAPDTVPVALAAGLPVLALADPDAARVGASMLTGAGLADLLSASVGVYVRDAIALCASPTLLAQRRARFAEAFAAGACEQRFARDVSRLEQRYLAAWAAAGHGVNPSSR